MEKWILKYKEIRHGQITAIEIVNIGFIDWRV